MPDTADNAPDTTNEEVLNDNAQAVADSLPDKTSDEDFSFVLDKYKSEGRTDSEAAMEQAKAYGELQSKFGAFTGAPDEYAVEVSEAMSEHVDLEDYKDDPILEEAKLMAKEMGINNDGFNRMTELYFKGQLADVQALEANRAEEMKALGPNAERRLSNISDWAKANLDADTSEALAASLTSAATVNAIEAVIARGRNAIQTQDTNPAEVISHDELKAMQHAKDDYGNPLMNNPEYRAKVDNLYKQRFPD